MENFLSSLLVKVIQKKTYTHTQVTQPESTYYYEKLSYAQVTEATFLPVPTQYHALFMLLSNNLKRRNLEVTLQS